MNTVFDDGFASELVLVSAADAHELCASIARVEAFLRQAPAALLRDVAYTCSCERGSAVLAVVASTTAELRMRLALARARIESGVERIRDRSGTYYSAARSSPKVAFLVPGAASFYPDMLRDLILAYPACRIPFDELEEALAGAGPFSPWSFVFPPAARYRRDADALSAGGYAEALVSVQIASRALIDLLRSVGVSPDGYAGFLGGDLVALLETGALGDLKRQKRLAFMQDVYRVSARVVKGMPAARALGHDPDWCAKFAGDFRKLAHRWLKDMPRTPVYSCALAAPLGPKFKHARKQSAELWTTPLNFPETLRRMHADGYRAFVEAGPRSLLSTVACDALRGLDCEIVITNRAHRSGLVQFQHALGQLAAMGLPVDLAPLFAGRRALALDFSAPLALEARADSRLRLSRAHPQLVFISDDPSFLKATGSAEPAAPGQRARQRAAAQAAARARRQQQFDFGASFPLVSDAEATLDSEAGAIELVKTFTAEAAPFFGETAVGSQQVSYSDPTLRGRMPLTIFAAAEIMAEAASRLVPHRRLKSIDNLQSPRSVSFEDGRLRLRVKAVRIAAAQGGRMAVKAEIRVDEPDAAVRAPVVEATFTFTDAAPAKAVFVNAPLLRPRDVHWTSRDVYPGRLAAGDSLQRVRRADLWSEDGLDYEIEAPDSARAVAHTPLPMWSADPLLLECVAQGFALWRSHVRFAGALSHAFRVRRILLHGGRVPPGALLKCYLRLADVTMCSQVADVRVTGGDGNLILEMSGYEEAIERVPVAYSRLLLSPATAFVTEPLAADALGTPSFACASAFVTDVPYSVFGRNDELWLRTIYPAVLSVMERRIFTAMPGSTARRAEWLFGRIAAKDAVRRYLLDRHQARWTAADVEIWADERGCPRALGAWADNLLSPLHVSISHTAEFVVAVAASRARVGVDVERATRDLTAEFTAGAFASSELELAAAGVDAAAATIRFWCAKEAVSKALGTGLRYSPRALLVTAYSPDTGEVEVVLSGEWLEAFKPLRGIPLKVSTALVRGHALATCFLPEALLPET